MNENNENIMVLVHGIIEQDNLMKYLEFKKAGYHWVSGQKPLDAPYFCRIQREGYLIHVLNVKEKTIGFFPIEIYGARKQHEIIRKAVTVSELDTSLL